MNATFRVPHLRVAAIALLLGFGASSALQAQPPLPAPESSDPAQLDQPALPPNGEHGDDMEVLTRGPLHEAFAEVYQPQPTPGVVIQREPPPPIDEVPPEYAPEDDTIWVPGYWAWDDTREDFIWVSGVWRLPPPNHRWVPGYWAAVEGGFQWNPGFWQPEATQELRYLPPPPDNVDEGPSSPAPSVNHFWIPGCWEYYDADYRWRAGYWARGSENWIWVPSTYLWTPRGCIFRPGYWDHSVIERGVVCAPVFFRSPIYAQVGYSYRPRVVIETPLVLVHLFARPTYHHYYFGDFYGDVYRRQNYYACWDTPHRGGRHYDPIFSYYNWHSRSRGDNFIDHYRTQQRFFHDNPAKRPQHTWAAQRAGVKAGDVAIMARSMRQVAERPDAAMRLHRISEQDRQRITRQIDPVRKISQQRREIEFSPEFRGPKRPGGEKVRPGERPDGNRKPGRDIDRGQLVLPQVPGKGGIGKPVDGRRPGQQVERRPGSNRGQAGQDRPGPQRPNIERPKPQIPGGIPGVKLPREDRQTREKRPNIEKPQPNRPSGEARPGGRPGGQRPSPQRPSGQPQGQKQQQQKGQQGQPHRVKRPEFDADRSGAQRPQARPQRPTVPQTRPRPENQPRVERQPKPQVKPQARPARPEPRSVKPQSSERRERPSQGGRSGGGDKGNRSGGGSDRGNKKR